MPKNYRGKIYDLTWLNEDGNLIRIVQEIEIYLPYQVVYLKTRIRLGVWDTQSSRRS